MYRYRCPMKLLKIGIAGVRGIVGQTITPELVLNFACAFGTWLDGGTVLVGRDTRRTGPMLHSATLSALISTGCSVLDMGIAPTPVLQFMVRALRASGGVSISAGHNSKDWNALTFINREGTYLNSFQGEEVLDLYHLGQFARMPVEKLGIVEPLRDYLAIYLDALGAFIDVESISHASLRVVVDCCNGAGAGLVDELGRRLGCEMIAVNNEQSGYFPHDPEPKPRNAQQVASVMGVIGADAGFLTNSDVSRVSLVASREEAFSEEITFPLVAKSYLERKPGPLVTTLMTSRIIDDIAAAMNCPVVKTRVGQSHVVEAMLLEDAVIGGEGSGGVAVAAFQPAFDGFLTIALVLEAMAKSTMALRDLAAGLPRYHMVKEQVPCPLPRAYSIVNEVRKHYPGDWVETSDGLRLDSESGWIHIRASATEPLVRVYIEDTSKERAGEKAEEITHLVSLLVK
jgi:phosphomannomutase